MHVPQQVKGAACSALLQCRTRSLACLRSNTIPSGHTVALLHRVHMLACGRRFACPAAAAVSLLWYLLQHCGSLVSLT
jgi:hypothetical protein